MNETGGNPSNFHDWGPMMKIISGFQSAQSRRVFLLVNQWVAPKRLVILWAGTHGNQHNYKTQEDSECVRIDV